MPNRTILNKCGLFVTQVRKVSKKKEFGDEDVQTINMARLIAALSSNHSWRISRYLYDDDPLDPLAAFAELAAAMKVNWMNVDENDIMEIVTSSPEEYKLFNVFVCAHDKELMKLFKSFFPRLVSEFADGMEPIMQREV